MFNTIARTLSTYGFETRSDRRDTRLFWGCGSISNGEAVTITCEGDLVVIRHQTFFCNGEVERDTDETIRCRLGEMWEHLPIGVYRRWW